MGNRFRNAAFVKGGIIVAGLAPQLTALPLPAAVDGPSPDRQHLPCHFFLPSGHHPCFYLLFTQAEILPVLCATAWWTDRPPIDY